MKSARCLHIWNPMHRIDRKKRLVTRATHRDFMFHQKWTLLLKSEPPLLGGHTERTNVLEIAVNSREFQRIVFLSSFWSTFSDTIHWQNTNSSNLSNNWLVTIHPRNRTYTQKLSKNNKFREPPNKHKSLLECIFFLFIAEKSACWEAKRLSFEKYDNCWFAFILARSIRTFFIFLCFWRFTKFGFSSVLPP